jgi:hypothetical protein
MWVWLRMLRNVPTGISDFLGTMAVSTPSPERRNELDMTAFLAGFDKSGASRRRVISRKGSA